MHALKLLTENIVWMNGFSEYSVDKLQLKKIIFFSPDNMSGCVLCVFTKRWNNTFVPSLIKGALGKPGVKLNEEFNLFNVLDSKIKSQCHSFCFSILVLLCWYKWKTREQLWSWHPQNYKWGLLSETPLWKMNEKNFNGWRTYSIKRKETKHYYFLTAETKSNGEMY